MSLGVFSEDTPFVTCSMNRCRSTLPAAGETGLFNDGSFCLKGAIILMTGANLSKYLRFI